MATTKTLKVAVTGASGLLGRAVYDLLQSRGHNVVGTAFSRNKGGLIKLDLTNAQELDRFFSENYDVIVHCAAERRPDTFLNNSEQATQINVSSTRGIAEMAKKTNSFLIYISTDYVFDGNNSPYEVNDRPNPLNEYGKTKLAGEEQVMSVMDDNYVILRVPILYGPVEYLGEGAIDILIKALQKCVETRNKEKMDNYLVRYPTCVQDVARVICDISEARVASGNKSINGIAHYSAKESTTKYKMALVLAKLLNIENPDDLMISVDTKPDTGTADRPYKVQFSTKVLESWGIDASYVKFEDWWKKAIGDGSYLIKQ